MAKRRKKDSTEWVKELPDTGGKGSKRKGGKAKLGSGARFKALKEKLGKRGAKNPGALAAWIGRKKYGAKKFAQLGRKGKK